MVAEALALAEVGVNSMHDPTEGGLLGGLAEVAYASGRLVEVWEEKVIVRRETKVICDALGVDPLRLISSGCLIATLPEEKAEEARKVLEELGVAWAIIGRALEGEPGLILHRRDGSVERIGKFVHEELARLWAEPPSASS